jgi:hypothetical protein
MTNRLTGAKKLLAAGALLASVAMTVPVQAEGAVTATGKGIAGGVLLGAEIPMITCAIVGVESAWPYLLFGAAGAAGGAVGGYFLEGEAGDAAGGGVGAEPSLYLLAGGMALVVPTLIAVLNATAYEPGEGDAEGFDNPAEARRRRRVPVAVLNLDALQRDGVSLRPGVPAVELRRAFSAREVAQFGARQRTEVHVRLLQAAF